MRLSILACVSGRIESFAYHLRRLADCPGATDAEYCIGIWGESAEHEAILARHEGAFGAIRVQHVTPMEYWPVCQAYNAALRLATCDRCLIVNADALVDLRTLEWAVDRPDGAWLTGCIDEDSGIQYVGPQYKGAFPHVMALRRSDMLAVGGWDETFGRGIVYDDVDLCARLLVHGVRFRWDFSLTAYHQSHKKARVLEDGPTMRGRKKRINEAELLGRTRPVGLDGLWPLCWDHDKRRDRDPSEDGLDLQDALAARLVNYPQKAVIGL